MSTHTATIAWQRGEQPFTDNRYSRAHTWAFDGGAVVPGSSSPQVVRVPMSDPAAVDPEEAFVASLSSCHMLWFLSIAAARGFCVDRYRDAAVGHMTPGDDGKLWISHVELRPEVAFGGARQPDAAALAAMHHEAHDECFLARSVRSRVEVVLPG
jgi:organic hydroperoxide reductase OsmC/OhrA